MGAPETGTGEAGTGGGGWVVVQPGLPDTFTNVVETIQGLLQALIAILNILLAVLQIVKAFIAGLLNPLQALIDAIIAEIEAILNDLRQIGVYISGDTELDPPEFTAIIGGFTAYERRMIGRLVNRQDPTRPDFSSRSAVIAIFLYASADTTGVGQLLQVVQRVLAFFGRKVPVRVTSVPVSLQVTYGAEGALLSSFGVLSKAIRQTDVPNQANVRWLMAPSSQPTGFLTPAPKGFLVEVSTVRDGLLLAYDTYPKNALVGANVAKRIYGLVRDPKTELPFRLHGGPDMIDVTDLAGGTYSADADGTDRETRLYAYRSSADNVPIPIDALIQGSGDNKKYLLQRTFFVKGGFLSTAKPGQGFAITLNHEDMPYDADFEVNGGDVDVTVADTPADTVYVRISQVTDNIVDALDGQDTGPLESELNLWNVSSSLIVSSIDLGNVVLQTTNPLTADDKGEPSAPLTITFPASSTAQYMDAITAALCVLVLARTDLPAVNEGEPFSMGKAANSTGLEEISRFLFQQMVPEGQSAYYQRSGVSPEDFRNDLLRRARQLANFIYSRSGPLGDLESTMVDAAEALLSFKWSDGDSVYPDLTIIESLESSLGDGVGLNPLSVGMSSIATYSVYLSGNVFIARSPGFMQKTHISSSAWVMGQGSADYAPVVYNQGIMMGNHGSVFFQADFCRNVLTSEAFGSAAIVLNVAAAVLTLPLSPDAGAWTTIRLFPQGLPAVEAALDEVIKWVKAIAAGIQGFADVIIAYIEFLQARLLELQALIVRINGLLDQLASFSLPSMAGLVVTGNGTDGILQGLVTAENKPSENTQTLTVEEATYGTYGAGVVILAGGLPAILIEILQAFFPEQEG